MKLFHRINRLSIQATRTSIVIHWANQPMFIASREPIRFSERMGQSKYIRLPFGWRIMENKNG